MSRVPIRDLLPFQSNNHITVRICRMWRPKVFASEVEFSGLHCILVDTLGDAIQASIKEIDYDVVAPKIETGTVYNISHFHTVKSQFHHKVVPHNALIVFNERTIFHKVSNVLPRIPMHRFYFLDYSQFQSRMNIDKVLTDVMGRIVAIQLVEEKLLANTRIESKCEIHIENIRRNEVRVTLWSDAARNFDLEGLQQLLPPVFIVFTSLKVKEYLKKPVLSSTNATLNFINPEIPELESYKAAFTGFTMPIEILPPTTAIQLLPPKLNTGTKLSVEALNVLNPDVYKDQIVDCTATITRFNMRMGWWYKACPNCYKQMRPAAQNDRMVCPKHNNLDLLPLPWFKVNLVIEDNSDVTNVMVIGKPAEKLFGVSCYHLVVECGFTDQTQFPEPLLQVRGQTKTFQLRFGAFKTESNRNDLLIHAIFEEEPPTISAGQETMQKNKQMIEPMTITTPTPSSRKAPITPLPISSTPLKQKTALISKSKLAVKRALFTSLKQQKKKFQRITATKQETQQIAAATASEEDSSHLDNIPLKAFKKPRTSHKEDDPATQVQEETNILHHEGIEDTPAHQDQEQQQQTPINQDQV